MPEWVKEELGSAEGADWLLGALTMLSQVGRYFGLGETPRELAKRRWWDILAMRMVWRADIGNVREVMAVKIIG